MHLGAAGLEVPLAEVGSWKLVLREESLLVMERMLKVSAQHSRS